MKNVIRTAGAILTLSLACVAGAAQAMAAWIHSDARSVDTLRGTVPLLQLGSAGTVCLICARGQDAMRVAAVSTVQRPMEIDFEHSIKEQRAMRAGAAPLGGRDLAHAGVISPAVAASNGAGTPFLLSHF